MGAMSQDMASSSNCISPVWGTFEVNKLIYIWLWPVGALPEEQSICLRYFLCTFIQIRNFYPGNQLVFGVQTIFNTS